MIELLVVVIIIGILAGIAIPVFLSQREKAQDAAAKSNLRNAIPAFESYYVDEGGFPDGYPDDETEMKEIEPALVWVRSRGGPSTPLDAVGAIYYEKSTDTSNQNVVFGALSASGSCFYMLHGVDGTRYGSFSDCEDPWNHKESIDESSW